jgi:hypothetical protein
MALAALAGFLGGVLSLYAVRAWERWRNPYRWVKAPHSRDLSAAEVEAVLERSDKSLMVNLDAVQLAGIETSPKCAAEKNV